MPDSTFSIRPGIEARLCWDGLYRAWAWLDVAAICSRPIWVLVAVAESLEQLTETTQAIRPAVWARKPG